MKLTDIFFALAAGELSSQSTLVDVATGIRVEDYSKVISHINLGLTNLHERFNLRLGDIYIQMQDGVAEYHLNSKYAYSNPNGDPYYRYIVDSLSNPYKDDALKVIEVFTEIGEPLPLNDRTEEKSVFTPTQLSIQIPWMVPGDVLNVVYRAIHNNIKLGDYDDVSDIEVDLPHSYLEALLYFVAYRHFAGVGGQSGTPTSMGYFQKYEARCQQIEMHGIPNKDLSATTDFQRGGWV